MVANVKSAVVIAHIVEWPGYGMADPGLEIRQGHDNFLFTKSPEVLGPIQPLLNEGQGISLRRLGGEARGCGVKLTNHLNTVPR